MSNSKDLSLIQKIDAYVKGGLSEEQAEELWVELLQKPEYIDYLETELAVRDIIRKGRKEPTLDNDDVAESIGAGREGQGTRGLFGSPAHLGQLAAAAAVVFLVVVYLFWGSGRQLQPGQLALSSIDTRTELALPGVTRGQGALNPSDSLLNAGYHALVLGNREEALRLFRNLADRSTGEADAARAHLNIGILEYNSEHFARADSAFTSAAENTRADDFIREKAYWFLGNTYLRMERTGEARRALERAESFGGLYLKPVQRLLDDLSADG